MNIPTLARNGMVTLCCAVLTACSGGGSTSGGTVSISLMDRPVDDVTALYVTISEVWLKPTGSGPAFQLPMTTTPLTVNLLELNDLNASVLVDEAVVPAGSYNFVEMRVEDDDISEAYAMTIAGGMVPVDVDVPSNKIRLVSGFDVNDNQAVRFIFDWDVHSGLTNAVGRGVYLLRPAFRILDADEYGSISGSAMATTITNEASCANVMDPVLGKAAAYIYTGVVVADDIGSGGVEPLTTVDAIFNEDTGGYDYRVIVMPGEYTVAFTCQAALDEEGNEEITFLSPIKPGPVTVTAATPVEVVF
jgi:hypothetical protein